MKKLSLLLYTFILTTVNNYPQWTNQNPVADGNHLWSVFFVDDNVGWLVGSDGFIKKTTNGGIDWVEQNSGTSQTLKSVQFINENTGWICGENGIIIKTTNGGQSWFELLSGTTQTLNDLHFVDINTGYIAGSNETILKTTNGGTSWLSLSSGNSFDLFSVDFIDANLGYAVGGRDSSKFLKTTDGGLIWITKTLDLGAISTPILNCVEFIDANTGWVGTEGLFLNHSGNISKTTDGGETWSSVTLWRPEYNGDPSLHYSEDNSPDNQRGIRSIYFKDANNGCAVGGTRDGWWRSIFTTTNGGATWVKKYGYSEQTGLLSVFVTDNGKGWAVGYSGVIYITNDNGSTWSQILSGKNSLYYAGDWITSVFMVNENTGWAAGYRKGIWYYPFILKTTNGGKSWVTVREFGDSFNKTSANIFFVDENTGWVSFYDKVSFKTTNGGATWFSSSLSANEKYFADQNTGWAAYEPVGIFKSIDGGSNWIQKSYVNSRSVYFSDLYNGWAAGNNGSILKSTDGGETWIAKSSNTISKLNFIRFYESNVGFAVGNSGTVLLSTDGGESWLTKDAGTNAELKSIAVTSSTSAWIVGNGGKILNTTDLGNNWNFYQGVTSANLASVHFIDQYKGWAAGDNSIIKYSVQSMPPTNHFVPVWSGSGYMLMNIYVTGVELIGGGGLNAGDEIAVFDGEHCVGAALVTEPFQTGGYILIKASTDNPATNEIDGFINGNPMSFKFWLSAISEEITDYTANYISGSGLFTSLGSATVEFANVLPVELVSFSAGVNNGMIQLIWKTATETNNYGFEVERTLYSNSNYQDWTKIGFVNGSVNSTSPITYTFVDNNLYGGSKFIYRLKQIDVSGSFGYSNEIEVEVIPDKFSLYQNYPNPFNPTTKIRYQLPLENKVTIQLYDVLGNQVATLVNERKEPGAYEVEFNAQGLASGTYIYRIVSGSFVETRKMVLLR